jgi:hypothetical protein
LVLDSIQSQLPAGVKSNRCHNCNCRRNENSPVSASVSRKLVGSVYCQIPTAVSERLVLSGAIRIYSFERLEEKSALAEELDRDLYLASHGVA